jgi:hypothetical protein
MFNQNFNQNPFSGGRIRPVQPMQQRGLNHGFNKPLQADNLNKMPKWKKGLKENENEENNDNKIVMKLVIEDFVNNEIFIPHDSKYCNGIEIKIKSSFEGTRLERDEITGDYKIKKSDMLLVSNAVENFNLYKDPLFDGLRFSIEDNKFYYAYDVIRLFLLSKDKEGMKLGLKMILEKEWMDEEFEVSEVLDMPNCNIGDGVLKINAVLNYKGKYNFTVMIEIYLENNYSAYFRFFNEPNDVYHLLKDDIMKKLLLDKILEKGEENGK